MPLSVTGLVALKRVTVSSFVASQVTVYRFTRPPVVGAAKETTNRLFSSEITMLIGVPGISTAGVFVVSSDEELLQAASPTEATKPKTSLCAENQPRTELNINLPRNSNRPSGPLASKSELTHTSKNHCKASAICMGNHEHPVSLCESANQMSLFEALV